MTGALPSVPDGILGDRLLVGEERRLKKRGLTVAEAMRDLRLVLGNSTGATVVERCEDAASALGIDGAVVFGTWHRNLPFHSVLLEAMYGPEPFGELGPGWGDPPEDWGPINPETWAEADVSVVNASLPASSADGCTEAPDAGDSPTALPPGDTPDPNLNDELTAAGSAGKVGSVAEIVDKLREASDARSLELRAEHAASAEDVRTVPVISADTGQPVPGLTATVAGTPSIFFGVTYEPVGSPAAAGFETSGLAHDPASDAPPLPAGALRQPEMADVVSLIDPVTGRETPWPLPGPRPVPDPASPFAPAVAAIDGEVRRIDVEIAALINRAEKLQQARAVLLELAA